MLPRSREKEIWSCMFAMRMCVCDAKMRDDAAESARENVGKKVGERKNG